MGMQISQTDDTVKCEKKRGIVKLSILPLMLLDGTDLEGCKIVVTVYAFEWHMLFLSTDLLPF